MRAAVAKVWENAGSSFWFVPALLVGGGVALAVGLLFVDGTLAPQFGTEPPWLYGGTAGAARTVLSVVAGSLITVISIAFSITLLALQQASSQYSPRILRNFTSDHGNQIVLGTYLATFTYALLVLRGVREPTGDQSGFVPSLSVTVAILLALVSIGMLVYYIDHIAASLDVSAILPSIRQEVDREIERLFPTRFDSESVDPPDSSALLSETERQRRGQETVIRSEKAGYLRRLDWDALVKASAGISTLVSVCLRPGDYVHPEEVLARVWSEHALTEEQQSSVMRAFQLDRSRSIHQDPLFGVRQMVDIGVKALSPGIYDPTTCEQSLDHLEDVAVRLLRRAFPSPLRSERGTSYLFNRPTFGDFVDASFSQIRHVSRSNVHVTLHLLTVLEELIQEAPTAARTAPLRRHVEETLAGLDLVDLTPADRRDIHRRATQILDLPLAGGRKDRRAA